MGLSTNFDKVLNINCIHIHATFMYISPGCGENCSQELTCVTK